MGHYDRFREIAELIDEEYAEYQLPEEFGHIKDVMAMGAKKHGDDNWLKPDGNKSSHKDMHDSMFHHLAESYNGSTADGESGFHPLLHLATRALMVYTRQQRAIVHKDDVETKNYNTVSLSDPWIAL